MQQESARISKAPLESKLDTIGREERQKALRTLLQHPLLTAEGDHSAILTLVRRHADALRELLAHNANWSLQVTANFARLRKTPPELTDASRGAVDRRSGLPFTRARYILLCLALAALERSERQTTLGRLATDIAALYEGDELLADRGFGFDLKFVEQRRNLVQVLRFLLDQRVLKRVQGDEELFIKDAGSDVLYSIQRPVLTAMLSVQRGPSMIDETAFEQRLAAIIEEPLPDTEEGRNRRIRTRLMRHLLDNPVLYYDELNERERVYLDSQRPFLLRQVEEMTGLEAEVRKEGIAILDHRGDMTDIGLPEEGTEGHLTLLLAEHLAGELRKNPEGTVGFAALCEHTAKLISQHKKHWRKDVEAPGADRLLTAMTVERLAALRLVRQIDGGELKPLPAIARYALLMEEQEVGETPLFHL